MIGKSQQSMLGIRQILQLGNRQQYVGRKYLLKSISFLPKLLDSLICFTMKSSKN